MSVMGQPFTTAEADVVEHRIRENGRRLLKALDTTEAVTANAAVGDYLDAVYAARMPYRHEILGKLAFDQLCRDTDPAGRMLAAVVWARGESTHHWVRQASFKDGGYTNRYFDHYGAWWWVSDPDPTSQGEQQRFYRQYLADKPVDEVIEPLEKFITRDLRARLAP